MWKILLQSTDQVHWCLQYPSTDPGMEAAVEAAGDLVPWTMEMMVVVPVVVDDDVRAKVDNNCIGNSC
jgi:hypothetical protein